VVYVSYKDHKSKKHILAIMKTAEGKTLQELMIDFQKNPRDTWVRQGNAEAYYDLGATLAKFYRTVGGSYSKTLVHGDMHSGNIFYHEDHAGHVVTLIDNERIAYSLDKAGSISADLGYLFVVSPFVMNWAKSDFLNAFDAKKWYSIVIPSFFLGFISTLPEGKRVSMFEKVKGFLLKFRHPDDFTESADSRRLQRLIENQLDTLKAVSCG